MVRFFGLKLYNRFVQPEFWDLKDPLLEIAKDSINELEKRYEDLRLRNIHGISRSLQELLEHNEDSMLEFKASMWTKYRGADCQQDFYTRNCGHRRQGGFLSR